MKTKITEKYLILRHLGVETKGGKAGAYRSLRSSRESTLKAELKIEEDVLSKTEAETLSRESGVLSIAPAIPMKLLDPVVVKSVATADATNTWGISAVKADQSAFTGKDIVVAVLDTGIDRSHRAFQGINIVEQDFTGEGNEDSNGHGTHCAGTIFGKEVNGTRIGIAPGIKKALIGKVIGSNGGGTDSIIKAIQWALNEGAHIISMSLGIDFPGYVKYLTTERGIAIEAATSIALEGYRANINIYGALAEFIKQRGLMFQPTIIVAAAGNESRRPDWEVAVSPPAAASGIISVAALEKVSQGLDIAYFSNSNADVSAPGVKILSAAPGGGLAEMSGTSMATPHVAGVAALWAEKLYVQNILTQKSLSSKLIGSAKIDLLLPNIDPNDVGGGIVQAP